MIKIKRLRSLPLISILCVAWALFATIFALGSAATNFTVKIPFIADIFSTPSDLEVMQLSFTVDANTVRLINGTIDVRNNDAISPHSGVIYVSFYNVQNVEIARGSVNTGTISAGVRIGNIKIVMVWITGYTMTDFEKGKVMLTQKE